MGYLEASLSLDPSDRSRRRRSWRAPCWERSDKPLPSSPGLRRRSMRSGVLIARPRKGWAWWRRWHRTRSKSRRRRSQAWPKTKPR